jgi:hypothetical protein
VSVFLRWGMLGILGVAGLLYAYNASKRLAAVHAARAAPVAAAPAVQSAPAAPAGELTQANDKPATAADQPVPSTPAHCEAELVVAQRAIDMRKQGAPLDRVLRIQEIAWQESPARRQRLEQVATRWFGYEGDFAPETLRIAVVSDCEQHSPPP